MKKIAGLDYIRAISAILVLLYHYTTRYFDSYFGETFESDHVGLWWGCWAVSAFFILSGFLTVYNLKGNMSFWAFLKKRFIRLYPGYFFCVIITTLFTLVFAFEKFIGVFPTVMNFTVIQNLLGIESVDGAYWTLLCEIVFYFVVAFAILIKCEKHLDIISMIWLGIIACFSVVGNLIEIPGAVRSIFGVFVIEKYAHTFIAGISLYYILESGRRKWISIINLAVCILIHFCRFNIMSGVFVVICISMIIIFVKTEFSFKYDKPLIFLAGISFPLYLLHQNIGYIIMYKAYQLGFHYCVGLVAAIVVSLAIAFLVQNYFANPVGKYLKNKL